MAFPQNSDSVQSYNASHVARQIIYAQLYNYHIEKSYNLCQVVFFKFVFILLALFHPKLEKIFLHRK